MPSSGRPVLACDDDAALSMSSPTCSATCWLCRDLADERARASRTVARRKVGRAERVAEEIEHSRRIAGERLDVKAHVARIDGKSNRAAARGDRILERQRHWPTRTGVCKIVCATSAARPFCFIVWRSSPARTTSATPTSAAAVSDCRTIVVPSTFSTLGGGTGAGAMAARETHGASANASARRAAGFTGRFLLRRGGDQIDDDGVCKIAADGIGNVLRVERARGALVTAARDPGSVLQIALDAVPAQIIGALLRGLRVGRNVIEKRFARRIERLLIHRLRHRLRAPRARVARPVSRDRRRSLRP